MCLQAEADDVQGGNSASDVAPLVWYMPPVIPVGDEHERQQDEITALSNSLSYDLKESERAADIKEEDDVLCDLLSRHWNDVDSHMFRDTEDVHEAVHVQPIDASETQNAQEHVSNNSTSVRHAVVEKSHASSVCRKTFGSSSILETHKCIHTGDVCHTDEDSLTKHKHTHTCEWRYVCDIRTKSFTTYGCLTTHKQTHPSQRPHKCDVCLKQFTQRRHLKTHMLTHGGKKPYTCDICRKEFTQRGSLSRHMLTHTGERPHKCDICHKQFADCGTLNKHMLTHTSERPHKCDVCLKQFTQLGNLKQHMLTHTGRKPHKCYICHKQFTERSSLKRHMITHMG